MDGWTNGEVTGSSSVLPLFLGLFLTLLAFFIMFISVSLPDPSAVVAGGPGADAGGGAATNVGRHPDAIALASVAGAFQRLGATMLGQPAAAPDGLDVSLPARSLFADQAVTIRPAAIAALDRTATALASPRGENRLVLEVTIGLGLGGRETAAAVRRASGLAAALLRRGAPAEAFTAGTAYLASDDVRFRFRLVGNTDELGSAF